jgi:hypothetical protein
MKLRVRVSVSAILLLILSLIATPARAATAGDVVTAEPTTVYLLPGRHLEVPVNAWHLVYRSTSATGSLNAVSGTLLVPKARYPLGARPIVGYATGTHGLGDQCAPSVSMREGREAELALISLLPRVTPCSTRSGPPPASPERACRTGPRWG